MSGRSYKACAVVLLIFIFFITAAAALAETDGDSGKKTVTVAVVEQEGFWERDEDGALRGYAYDYIMKLAQYADWDLEFVFPESDDPNQANLEMMEKVSSGKVDIMSYSQGMEAVFAYPEKSYGYAFTTLVANKSNLQITEDNLRFKDNLRIAVIGETGVRNEGLDSFCRLHSIAYTEVDCDSEEDQLRAIKDGRADVMVSLNTLPLAGTKVVAGFADRPFYFVCSKKNEALCREIDQAMDALDYTQPDFRKKLRDEYFSAKKEEIRLHRKSRHTSKRRRRFMF